MKYVYEGETLFIVDTVSRSTILENLNEHLLIEDNELDIKEGEFCKVEPFTTEDLTDEVCEAYASGLFDMGEYGDDDWQREEAEVDLDRNICLMAHKIRTEKLNKTKPN